MNKIVLLVNIIQIKILNYNTCLFYSIQHIRRNNGSVVRLYDINTNPMNPFEFIVIGDDKYVRLYDKRKTTQDPVKKFHRTLSSSNRVLSEILYLLSI